METIRIAHLYYDIMNLYGEHGNVEAFRTHLELQKIRVITHFLSIEDEIDFDKYDIFFIGSGNKEAFFLVLEDLKKRKKELQKAIRENKYFFITGNAVNLFGKTWKEKNGTIHKTLDIGNYETEEIDFRIVEDEIMSFSSIKNPVIGFQNRNFIIKNCMEKSFFKVIKGTGYEPKEPLEGIMKNNFYVTYLLGPLFVRNPYLLEFYIKKIVKGKNLTYTPKNLPFEKTAYKKDLEHIKTEVTEMKNIPM